MIYDPNPVSLTIILTVGIGLALIQVIVWEVSLLLVLD